MSTQVVVTLPDDFYVQAQHWAALPHREVPEGYLLKVGQL